MPIYIDIHSAEGVTPEAIADAHRSDVAIQAKYGVNYLKYWLDQRSGKVFCLCVAPDEESARKVHEHAHGMLADRILEIDPDLAETFLGGGVIADSGAVMMPHSHECDPGVRTLVFTDIVGSTALTQRLGDAKAMEVVDAHDRVVRASVAKHYGREVKHLGDGIMAVFVAPADAIRCAAEVHAALHALGDTVGEPVRVRIGAASGVPVERAGDFFGSTVQLAARLCAAAQPGQTLVSSEVVSRCSSHRFEDIGEVKLKGFDQPVRAHALAD